MKSNLLIQNRMEAINPMSGVQLKTDQTQPLGGISTNAAV